MSNFKYIKSGKDTYLIVGDNRIKVKWLDRWVPESETPVIFPETIELNKSSISIDMGLLVKEYQLIATVTPIEASNEIIWESSNEKVATVDETGLVKGITIGTSIITCMSTYDENIKVTCSVSVISNPE